MNPNKETGEVVLIKALLAPEEDAVGKHWYSRGLPQDQVTKGDRSPGRTIREFTRMRSPRLHRSSAGEQTPHKNCRLRFQLIRSMIARRLMSCRFNAWLNVHRREKQMQRKLHFSRDLFSGLISTEDRADAVCVVKASVVLASSSRRLMPTAE